jgi:hypothetical protein
MRSREPSRVALTKALCSALAGGASLERALLIAKEASPAHAPALERAAHEVGNDVFRRDVLQRLELEPPIAGVVLGRVRREYLADAATIALDAMRIEEPRAPRDAPLPEMYLLLAAVVSIAVTLWLWFWARGVAIEPSLILIALGAGIASLLASLVTLLRKWPVGSRFELLLVLLFPPLFFFDLQRIMEHAHRPLLDAKRVLIWLAAGELAGLVPGAVIAALLADVRSFREHRLLRALETRLRGTADARRAAETWMATAKMPAALVQVAQAVLPGDSNTSATLRLARMVALLPARARLEQVLPYVALGLLVAAAYAITSGLLLAIARVGVGA